MGGTFKYHKVRNFLISEGKTVVNSQSNVLCNKVWLKWSAGPAAPYGVPYSRQLYQKSFGHRAPFLAFRPYP